LSIYQYLRTFLNNRKKNQYTDTYCLKAISKFVCKIQSIPKIETKTGGLFWSSNPSSQKNHSIRSITLRKTRKEVAKSSPHQRTAYQRQEPVAEVVKMGNRNYKKVEILPRNTAQETYVDALLTKRMVFAVGPAGTGKTLLAVLRAIKALRDGEISKIILTRPAVSVDEKHGFLPGDLNEKMAPWTRPIFDVFEEYYGLPETARMLEEGIIEIAPLGFMRGRTFKYAYVIADEMQNATPDQTKMLLTRIGEGTSMIITGDLRQHDRGFEKNGLKDFLERFAANKKGSMAICTFGREHIERDELVAEVLDVYGEE
jgi:phosphate starvation-inducible PhoH-like protein